MNPYYNFFYKKFWELPVPQEELASSGSCALRKNNLSSCKSIFAHNCWEKLLALQSAAQSVWAEEDTNTKLMCCTLAWIHYQYREREREKKKGLINSDTCVCGKYRPAGRKADDCSVQWISARFVLTSCLCFNQKSCSLAATIPFFLFVFP